jgi:hypothetical protein
MANSDIKSKYFAADGDAADADSICQSQTPAGGGEQDLTINGANASGGVATFTAARKVTIASAGTDDGRTFTVTGTDINGDALVEAITGPDTATVTTTGYFKTVTQVTVDDDTAGAITVGMSADALDVIFAGRMRLRGLYIVHASAAGSVSVRDGSATGTVGVTLGTVADATVISDVEMRDNGILFGDGGYVAYTQSGPGFSNITAFYA